MNDFEKLLAGGDLRTTGNSNAVVKLVLSQKDFDELFALLFHKNRLVVMRAPDAIEKTSVHFPHYLNKHKAEILALSNAVKNKELQWHLALLLSRIKMNEDEFNCAWKILMNWVRNKSNSRIVKRRQFYLRVFHNPAAYLHQSYKKWLYHFVA
jgi:hypothetical protein